jgi:L-fucose mutarotase
MLKNISLLLTPDLLKVLCEMGHGDEIVIADGNFPAHSINERVIRLDGHGGAEMLGAIMSVIPLDTYAEPNAMLMEVVKGDEVETPIWEEYKEIIKKYDSRGESAVGEIDRFDFYEEAKKAYCIIATSESAIYANIMLQKGVI